MKPLFGLLLLLPFTGTSQKVKVNEYDKFIKQQRIELEPQTIYSTDKAKITLTFNSIASTFYASISGFGWGGNTINAGQEVIFLFSNDSTVSIKSTGLQSYNTVSTNSSYKHQYFISQPAIEALSRYELVGIRKYDFNDYADMKVSGEYATKVKRLSALFLEELKKAKILHTLKRINIKDVGLYVGDSVMFCTKVFNTRYFDQSKNKPTLLDLTQDFDKQPVYAVIWQQDRTNFSRDPESLYKNKDVCICGVVQLRNNIPQIEIHDRNQIILKTPIALDDVADFIGDSITVQGKVMGGQYFANSLAAPTLLNMGAAYPDQLLSLLIEGKDRKNFLDRPEEYYLDKEINVSGKVALVDGQPQMIVRSKDQITVLKSNARPAAQKTQILTSSASYAAQAPQNEIINASQSAKFPGGAQAFASFLQSNLSSPVQLEPGQKVTVVTSFVIDTTGAVTNIKITKSAGKLFDKEVMRVLQTMPKWSPRLLPNGKPAKEMFSRAVTFDFIDERKPSN